MKAFLNSKDFVAAVKTAATIIPANPVIPAIGGILFETTTKGILVSSTNFDDTVEQQVDACTAERGAVLLPAKELIQLVRNLSNTGTVSIETAEGMATISCGQVQLTMRTLVVDDLPDRKAAPAVQVKISADEWANAVTQTAVAADVDNTIPALAYLRMEFNREQAKLVATDRYRMVVRQLECNTSSATPITTYISAKALLRTAKILKKDGADIDISFTHDFAFFNAGRVRIVHSIGDTQFPEYEKLLARRGQTSATVTVNCAPLIAAVKQVISDKYTPVCLEFQADQVRVTSRDGSIKTLVPCTLDGDPITIAFTGKNLVDALRVAGTSVTIQLTTPRKPMLVVSNNYQHLMMPHTER